MTSDFDLRKRKVIAVLDDIAKQEALGVAKRNWSSPVVQKLALERIRQSREDLASILDQLPTGTLPEEKLVTDAYAEAALAYVETVVKHSRSADIRIAQFQGYRQHAKERQHDLDTVAKHGSSDERLHAAEVIVSKVKSAMKALSAVAKEPLRYTAALQYWNNKLIWPNRAQPFGVLDKVPIDVDNLLFQDKSVDELTSIAQVARIRSALQLTASDLEKLAGYLGAAAALLTVSTIVLATLADQKHWGEALSKATFSAGAGLALGAVITGANLAAVTSSIASSFGGAAAVTAEIPPVAFAMVALGLVIVVGIAASELFSALIDLVFGGGAIPPSLRLEMSAPMANTLRSQMASSMASSMS